MKSFQDLWDTTKWLKSSSLAYPKEIK
jgi:hypothetical protein